MKTLFATFGALALVCSFATQAQPTEAAKAEFAAAAQAAQKASVHGPSEVKLGEQAKIKLPEGLFFVPPAESGRLLTAMGNRVGEGLLGMIGPSAPDADWFIVMRFQKSGYIKDDDAKDWNTEDLLKGLKEGTEESNKERRTRGLPELEIVGWVEAPQYDATAHRLVWSLQSKQKGAPAGNGSGVNYNTYALGREGYISLNLVTELARVQAEKPVAHTLLAALDYNDGKRYRDFNSATDHVAEYGLAALIGGVAAKKLGLFAIFFAFLAKFAKVIGVAAIALGAIFVRFFRKKKPGAATPAPPPPQA